MSSPDISRRLFLRGKVAAPVTSSAIRPPWSVDEGQFISKCSRCDDCISACPENIITRGEGGFPEINFKSGECTFCAKCAATCKTGAITSFGSSDEISRDPANAWNLDVNITSTKCLSLNAVVCRSCGDSCEPQAINFQLKLGGVSEPIISLDDCTGCGACVSVCPVDAVQIKPVIEESIAA